MNNNETSLIIDKAVGIIKKGGLVAMPTDTVYCLAADAFNQDAVARIFDVKKRPGNIALPVIVADMEQLFKICQISPLGLFLAGEFFPRGLTLVMPRSPDLPDIVTAGKDTVAVRIQDNPIASDIVRKLGKGIAATSANIHGMKSPVTAEEVREQLGDTVDLIIEGNCSGGIESTIVDVTGGKPVILREGAIPAARIEAAWQKFLKNC